MSDHQVDYTMRFSYEEAIWKRNDMIMFVLNLHIMSRFRSGLKFNWYSTNIVQTLT